MARYIFADSNNRTPTESSNAYHLDIVSPIKNVTRVDLVSAKVPNSVYNVTTGSILLNGSTAYVLEPGFYSACGLASRLTTELINTDFDENTGKFVFWSTASFTLEAVSSDVRKVLGLTAGTKTSALQTSGKYNGVYTVKSENVIDLTTNDFVFLDIEELRSTSMVDCKSFSGNTFSGSTVNSIFAVIPLDVDSGSIKFFKETSDYKMSMSFTSPIGTLSKLTIRWLDRNGTPLNFNGLDDNSFVLRCHTVREPIAPRIETPLPVPKEPVPVEKPKGEGPKRIILIGGGVALIAILLWFFFRARTTQYVPRPTGYSQILRRPM